MANLDLTAVCERHDIEVDYFEMLKLDARWEARFWWDAEECESVNAATKEEAVCALLVARYGMETTRADEDEGETTWEAAAMTRFMDMSSVELEYGRTELAAVVALADRLQANAMTRGE